LKDLQKTSPFFMADTLILSLAQCVVSAMRFPYEKIAVKFAIPDVSENSGFCMLTVNLLHAELQQDDPLCRQ
jgi:hypothetical protein